MARKQFYITLKLRGQVTEETPSLSLFSRKEYVGLRRLLQVIATAREHKRIQALALIVKDLSIGWAQIEEVHRELDRFHQAGKRSIIYLDAADNKRYYLATGAQKIVLPPPASLELLGLRAEVLFFKNLLAYLGVEPELFSLGEYKSAAEMFTRREMSEASRRMGDAILSDLQERLKTRIASRVSQDADTVQTWIDQGPYTAAQALEKGLIDGIRYEDEIDALVKQDLGQGIRPLPADKLRIGEGFLKRLFTPARPQIAYLVAEGIINTGESRRGRARRPVLGSETIIDFLRTARKKKRIKAVIVRINSPGGSALASDLIWREIKLTDEKKPVIVSFGDVAASGGYYIASSARRILGMPSSLTGSIGVISGKFNLQRLFSNIGVSVDWLDKGKRAGLHSAVRPYSNDESQVIRDQMRHFYEDHFLEKVAAGRRKSVDEVRTLAEGRVWTGSQAHGNGLLDDIGGIMEALKIARREAGLADEAKMRVVRLTRRRSLSELFSFPLMETTLDDGVQALMPEEWIIR